MKNLMGLLLIFLLDRRMIKKQKVTDSYKDVML